MIDIHCHILPDIDDGARNIKEAMAMARLSVDGGTTDVIATPHVGTTEELARAVEISGRVTTLQRMLDDNGIILRLHAGAEVFPTHGLLTALDGGSPLCLGQARRHLLLDTPFIALPHDLPHLVYDLQMRGVTPILAHPERVMAVQRSPTILESLVHRGLLLQIDGASLLGRHGAAVANTARSLIEYRWVQFVATDAHSLLKRYPDQGEAARVLRLFCDEEDVANLVTNNGRRVLSGETVPATPVPYNERPRTRYWLSWLFGGRQADEITPEQGKK